MTARSAPRRWRLAILLGVTSISMVALHAVRAHAGDRCLPAPVSSVGPACSGEPIDRIERRATVRFLPTPERPRIEAIESLTRPQTPPSLDVLFPQGRGKKLDARVMALLRKEIAELQTLLRLTPTNDRERPELLRRVGDRYWELESASRRDHDDYQRRARRFEQHGQASRAKQLLAMAARSGMVEAVARRGAIEAFAELDANHPSWCQRATGATGGRRCADDVLLRLARAYEHAGEPAQARESYDRLLTRFPRSAHALVAHLYGAAQSFDHALAQSTGWSEVQAEYEQLRRWLQEDGPARAYVTYQLAQAHWHQGQFDQALVKMLQTLVLTARSAEGDGLGELGRLARRDAVLLFALAGDPGRALEMFRLFTGSRSVAIQLSESLGSTYWSVGLYDKAALLYRELAKHNGGAAACGYQERIARATMASAPHERATVLAALERLLRTQRTFRVLGVQSPAAQDCTRATAALLTEVAASWHGQATGDGDGSGGGDTAGLAAAARVYRLLLDNFSPTELESLRWPDLGAPQRPVPVAIRYALAELRSVQGNWQACGRSFDAVARELSGGPLREDAVLGAAACYARAQRVGSAGDAAMLGAFDRFLCQVRPPRTAGHGRDAYVRIKVARARLALTHERVAEGARQLRSVAVDYADSPWGVVAGQLYLDALMRIAGDDTAPRPTCFDEAEQDIATLERLYCVDAGAMRNADHCARFAQVRRRVPREKAAALLAHCEQGGDGATARCRAAGQLYRRTWEQQARAECLADGPDCLGSAGLLYHGARAFEGAGDLRQAISLRRILLDERYHLEGTALAQRALLELAGNYQRSGEARKAARAYERFVRDSRESVRAPVALLEATRNRLTLGEQGIAARHVRALVRWYGPDEPAVAGEAALLVAHSYAALQRWDAVLQQLATTRKLGASKFAIDVQVRTHALRGRAQAGLARTGAAERAYGLARDAWEDEAACLREIASGGGGDAEQAARKERALAAVAESLLFLGDLYRQRATQEALPAFRGRASRRSVERHVDGAVTSWLRVKRSELRVAAAAYDRVLELGGGNPPPHYAWLARQGSASLWGDFVLQLRAASYPRRWNRAGRVPRSKPPLLWAELRAAYREMLWARSLPFEARAASANAHCVIYGKRQKQAAAVRTCEDRLAQLVPESPAAAERLVAADLPLRPAVPLRPAPLGIDGTPLTASPE